MLPKTPGMLALERRFPGRTIEEILVDVINRTGSVRLAGAELGVNYRTLWGYCDRLQIRIRSAGRSRAELPAALARTGTGD